MNTKRTPKRRRPQSQNSSVEFDRLEPRAMLAAVTLFDPASGLLVVDTNLTAVTIARAKFGQILVNGQQVGTGADTATNVNTKRIAISSTPGFNDQVTLNLIRSFTGPAGSIPFDLNLGSGFDTLNLLGSAAADNIRVLAAGIDLNNDSVVDIKNNGPRLNTLNYFGGAGNDFLFFEKAGKNFSASYLFDGQAGTDRMTFVGTAGDDRIGLFQQTGLTSLEGVECRNLEAPFTILGAGGNDTLNVLGGISEDLFSMDTQIVSGLDTAVLQHTSEGISNSFRILTIENLRAEANGAGDTIDFSAMTVGKRTQSGLTGVMEFFSNPMSTIRGTQGPDRFQVFDHPNVNIFGLGGDDTFVVRRNEFSSPHSKSLNGGLGTDNIQFVLNDGIPPSSFNADFSANSAEWELEHGAPGQVPKFLDKLTGFEIFSLQVEETALPPPLNADFSQLTAAKAQLAGITQIRLVGGKANDILIGSGINDFIDGREGDDQLEGKGGDDEILGGSGNDTILGANGNDILTGGDGNDSIFGGPGNDFLSGENGNDLIRGGDGDDTLLGGDGDDQLFGEDGNDTLNGGPGNNFLDEGPGQGGVVFHGTPGNDVIRIGRQVIGGVAHVVATINGVTTKQRYTNGETIIVHAGAGHDRVVMEDSAGEKWQAVFHGDDGNDTLRGAQLDDLLNGGAGNDRLFGEGSNDILVGGDGDDRLFGGEGRDLLIGGAGRDWLFGFRDEDLLIGGFTLHDNRDAALRMLMAEWNSGSTYESRSQAIQNGSGSNLNGTGVFLRMNTSLFDDGETDRIFGQAERDLFFAGTNDQIFGRAANELVI